MTTHSPSATPPAYGPLDTDQAVRSEAWLKPGDALTLGESTFELDIRRFVLSGQVRPEPQMFEDFLGLATASDDQLLTYARTWGLFDLCQHGLPMGHPTLDGLPITLAESAARVFLVTGICRQVFGREQLLVWRFWSGQARAIANIGIRLRRSELPHPGDISKLYDVAPWIHQEFDAGTEPLRPVRSDVPDYADILDDNLMVRKAAAEHPARLEDLRFVVRSAVDFWLEMANVSLRLRWYQGRPVIVLTGDLFGSLGVRLLMAITAAQGFATCDGCGAVHVPARPNDMRRRSFCHDCRIAGVPNRLAQRRSTARRAMTGIVA